VATELGGTQVASLLETLPGIASVLRNPVADAFVGLIRAGARLGEFKMSDAEEILRYAVRRTLMTQDETDRVLVEVKSMLEKRAERAAEREREREKAKKPAAIVRAKPRSAVKKPAKAARPGKKKRR
jgi:urease accessory protein UreF